jgi:hypothetical protein
MAGVDMKGPLYEGPKASGSLGAEPVGGPIKGGKSVPDPLNFNKASGSGK